MLQLMNCPNIWSGVFIVVALGFRFKPSVWGHLVQSNRGPTSLTRSWLWHCSNVFHEDLGKWLGLGLAC